MPTEEPASSNMPPEATPTVSRTMSGSTTSSPTLFAVLNSQQTLRRILSIYLDSRHVRTWISVAAAVMVPIATLLVSLAHLISKHFLTPEDDNDKAIDFDDPLFMATHWGAYMLLVLSKILILGSVSVLGEVALIRAVAELYVHAKPKAWLCLLAAIRRILPVVLAGMVVVAGSTIGLALLYVPGIYFLVSCIGVYSAVLLEQKGPIEAVQRSFELVQNRRCYIFYIIFCLGMAQAVLLFVLNFVFFGAMTTPKSEFTVPGVLIQMIPMVIFYPLNCIAEIVIYINLRVDKEGLTEQILKDELQIDQIEASGSAGSLQEPLINIDEDSEQNETTDIV